MATNTCIHIVPALPPQIDDIGGYALNLALRLHQSHGIQSRFIVCDPEWNGPSRVEGFAVRRLRLRTEAGIWSLLASAKEKDGAVLLHYAGYGYDKLGVPLWLYQGIKSWLGEQTGQSATGQKKLCTVFHETMESCSKPWKIEFYLRKLQMSLAKGFHLRSKFSVTSTRRMYQVLEAFEPLKTLWVPTPCNVPVTDRSNGARRRNGGLRTVILGHPGSRATTVKAHANLLRTLEVKGRLASTMLLGTVNNSAGALTEDVCLLRQCVARERIGVLEQLNPADVSRHLAEADLFLSHCSGETATESSAFMAALAARCPAVLRVGKNTVPLNEIEHFIASDDSHASVWRFEQIIADGRLDQIATAGRQWYERYADWNVIARKYHQAICHQTLFEGEHLNCHGRPNPLETTLNTADACARQTVQI
jgi:hypothetical protein